MNTREWARRNRAIAEMVFGWTRATGDPLRPWRARHGFPRHEAPDFLGDASAFDSLLDELGRQGWAVSFEKDQDDPGWMVSIGGRPSFTPGHRAALVFDPDRRTALVTAALESYGWKGQS